ncbi:MAG: WD40 repeat domain-containing protein [Isosphaeraceae bacterium]
MTHRDGAVFSSFFLALSVLLSGCGPSTPRPADKGRGGGPVPVPWGIRVSAAAFSPDNRLLALGCEAGGGMGQGVGKYPPGGKVIKLWDLESGNRLGWLEGHRMGISGIAFLPDSHRLLSVGRDGTLKFWDAASRALVHTLGGEDEGITWVTPTPDGTQALSGGPLAKLKIWDLGRFAVGLRTH